MFGIKRRAAERRAILTQQQDLNNRLAGWEIWRDNNAVPLSNLALRVEALQRDYEARHRATRADRLRASGCIDPEAAMVLIDAEKAKWPADVPGFAACRPGWTNWCRENHPALWKQPHKERPEKKGHR